MEHLLNTHEIMARAAQNSTPELIQDTMVNIRMPAALKVEAQAVLTRHGVTLSAFVREALETMLQEYKQGTTLD